MKNGIVTAEGIIYLFSYFLLCLSVFFVNSILYVIILSGVSLYSPVSN